MKKKRKTLQDQASDVLSGDDSSVSAGAVIVVTAIVAAVEFPGLNNCYTFLTKLEIN